MLWFLTSWTLDLDNLHSSTGHTAREGVPFMTSQIAPLEVWMQFHKEGRKRFAKLMLIQGISQRQMADALGWRSHSYVGRLARGEVPTVTPEVAARIALVLGVGIDDLFLVKAHSSDTQSAPAKSGRAA